MRKVAPQFGLLLYLCSFCLRIHAAPTLTWSPASAQADVFPGAVKTIKVSYLSSEPLTDLDLFLVPELQPFVSASPSSFAAIGAEPQHLTLTIKVPAETPPGTTVQGTIHLRERRRTVPAPLSFTLNVVSADTALHELEDYLFSQFGTLAPEIPRVGDLLPPQVEVPEDIQDAFRVGADGVVVLSTGSLYFSSSWTPNDQLPNAILDLLVLIRGAGIRIEDLETAWSQSTFHRDGTDTGADLLERWCAVGITCRPGLRPAGCNPLLLDCLAGCFDWIWVLDSTTHILLSDSDTDSLVAGQFLIAGALTTASLTALHELCHAMIFRTACFSEPLSGFTGKEETIVKALEEAFYAKFLGDQQGLTEAQNAVIAAGGVDCLQRLGLAPPPAERFRWDGNGHFYEPVAVSNEISWTAASNAAVAAGGYLVTITSAAENDFVFSLIDSDVFWRFLPTALGPWIGAFRPPDSSERAGGWTWVTGEPFSFTAWVPGDPKGIPGSDYAHFWGDRTPTATWNDTGDNQSDIYSYVIEYDRNPEPAASAP
ncbi:MAG: hypothetical protein L0Z50_19230 [Verrucomicrobiales bacterium]|nr:hypothetical protein [Verrucomicrobiales bacterium]